MDPEGGRPVVPVDEVAADRRTEADPDASDSRPDGDGRAPLAAIEGVRAFENDEPYGDLRAVDAAVKRLRAKLRLAAPESEAIVTVRGVGYRLGSVQ